MIFNMTGKNSGGGSIVVSETLDTHGGTIKTITAQNVTNLQTKTITPTTSQQTINPDTGYDGFSQVIVEAGGGGTPTIQSLSVTPTTSQQTFNASGVDGYKPVTVAAMPSGTAGTPTATKGTVSNHSISVTPSVTNQTGYITGSTKTGTAVSVSASELVSGTYTVDSSGTKDVTNYASASVPSGTAGTPSVSKGTVSNHSISVTPSVTNTTGWITGSTKTGTAVTVSASELVSGSETKTANGTYDVTNLAELVVNVSGGSGSSVHIGTKYNDDNVIQSSITFYDLEGEPTSFVIYASNNLSTSSPASVAAVVFDGTSMHGQTVSTTSNANAYYDTGFTKSYSNGTLIVTATTARFAAVDYFLIYSYGGTAGCIDTKDVQVGSGATSITFTGLEDEPAYWSCVFKSNFGTSSGYQRVIAVANDGTNTCGFEMDSSAKYSSSHWTASYSNGSLTITSSGTNAGGYFHQPGYYQLTYAYDDGSSGNYQTKSVTYTPSTTQQTATIQADSGYDALKKVNITVNAMTSMTLPTASSATSSGTLKATITPTSSVQYINIPVGYNSTAQYYTISAASGGGSASIGSKTLTPSNRPTSIQFTSMSGSPKAFTLRCTAAMSRSSNSSYYYVAHIRYNGTNTYGNCWRMSNGNWTNITSGYSFSYSGTTLTITSSGSTTTSPGCFYPGEYELIYIY